MPYIDSLPIPLRPPRPGGNLRRMNRPLYSETLRYPRWWALPALLSLAIPLLVMVNEGVTDFLVLSIIAASLLFPVLFLLFARLKIEFTEDSFRYHFSLSGQQEYFREDIESIEVREHDPFAVLSGTLNPFRDKKVIMWGTYVIALRLKSGKQIEVSTQDPRTVRKLLTDWWGTAETEALDLRPLNRTPAQPVPLRYDTQDLV